jgi:serine protease Do
MENIAVVLSDGNGYIAKLKCIDSDSDLAVIKIEKNNLTAAKFGSDSDIITGKTVIAIGTPISFSLRNSASTGVISGVNRGLNSYYKLIQTDASINPGNSGGPLVNLQGNVIGINSSKFSGTGIEGLGFSIPVGTVKYVLGQFEKYGYVKRPYLGASFEEEWAAKIGLPTNNGLTVNGIGEGTPAQKSGLLTGDIVLRIGGSPVNTIIEYNELTKKYAPNGKVDFIIKRGGTIKTVNVTFGEK